MYARHKHLDVGNLDIIRVDRSHFGLEHFMVFAKYAVL